MVSRLSSVLLIAIAIFASAQADSLKPHLPVYDIAASFDDGSFSDAAGSGGIIKEKVLYAVESSEVGYGQTSSVGVRVTRGASVELKFSFKVKAIISSHLAEKDSTFQNTLTTQEHASYSSLKKTYAGGLRIPFLSYIGVNLNGKVEKEDMEQSAAAQQNYNEKAWAAKQIVESSTEQYVQVHGSMWVTGTSFIPTEAVAFIKFAQVKTSDGSVKNVISSSHGDLVAASKSGDPNAVEGSSPKLNIIPL